ncbi:hypothetical protein N2152v2_005972 [Parachlorella kessleri]
MCILCARAGKQLGHHLLGRLTSTSWLAPAAAVTNTQARWFSSLPEPVADQNALTKDGYVLHPTTMNANLLKTQYAVRGEIYLKAQQLAAQGKEIIYTNVGNPQQLGQKPITFNRQVLSLLMSPFLMDDAAAAKLFPKDVLRRSREVLGHFGGALGAYTDSRGSAGVRKEVAAYIQGRDGCPSDPENIFLTDGASVSVRYVLNALIRDENDAILVPIPQYPLYSASIQLYGGQLLPYNLKEDKGWGLDLEETRRTVQEARSRGVNVRGLVFINPGNPTGQCLTYEDLRELVKFAHEEKVVLMADEVYQPNVYQDEKPFVSAKKVMHDMGEPYASGVELASFHTVSKGFLGECGLRGGYVEFSNFHPGTVEELYKIASVNLSPNTVGQATMALMVNPPKPGDESYEQYARERDECTASLRRRAHMMTDAFNSLEGVTCNFTEGAMYSFPRLHLPPKAIAAAKAAGQAPDAFYCMALLEDTGIVTVPGAGFGQEEGTYHLRTTILPPEDKIAEFANKFKSFHEKFLAKYR